MARLLHTLPLMLLLLCAAPAFATRHTRLAGPNVIEYELTVTYGYSAPDCVTKQIYLINGEYPGPTITATEGDTLIVKVNNMLGMEGLSFHWHGIRQLNSNLMDGVPFVTQCPISPLDYMTYNMTLDKAGTFMYHGHLDFQVSAGLYGSLVVKDRNTTDVPFKYDAEFNIILNDWYHRSIYEMAVGLDSIPFMWIGEAQSLLMNGQGKYNCSLIPVDTVPNPAVVGNVKICDNNSSFCNPRTTLVVEKGKTYRLRLASIATLEAQNFAIANHSLTVVAADSFEVKPFVVGTEGLDVYAGQTVDVLFTANQSSGTYWIRTGVVGRNTATPFGLGILQYKDHPSSEDPRVAPPTVRAWNDVNAAVTQAQRYKLYNVTKEPVPKNSSRTIVLTGAQQKMDGYLKWAVNNIALDTPSIPYALGIPAGINYGPTPPDTVPNPWNYSLASPYNATAGTGYYDIPLGQVVDIVIQNTNNLGPAVASEYHPWHMHGHQFWVLAYGNGTFNKATDASKFNLVDPPFRNTVTVMAFGWVALRLKADNPGVWLFHCHIGPHLHMGMAIIFKTGTIPMPPLGTPRCGFH